MKCVVISIIVILLVLQYEIEVAGHFRNVASLNQSTDFLDLKVHLTAQQITLSLR